MFASLNILCSAPPALTPLGLRFAPDLAPTRLLGTNIVRFANSAAYFWRGCRPSPPRELAAVFRVAVLLCGCVACRLKRSLLLPLKRR